MIMQIDVEGSGPTLVLVHSLLTDSHAFDDVVPELAKNHRVVRLSLPGFGTTPPLDIDSPTIFDLADAVAAGLKTDSRGPALRGARKRAGGVCLCGLWRSATATCSGR